MMMVVDTQFHKFHGTCRPFTRVLYQVCMYLFVIKAGSELKPNRPSGHGKEREKNDFVHRSKTAKKDVFIKS